MVILILFINLWEKSSVELRCKVITTRMINDPLCISMKVEA